MARVKEKGCPGDFSEGQLIVLIVQEPQQNDPVITFNKDTYEIGEILEANCTTSPARPPPHVTWLINNDRVDDSLTKPFSNGRLHGHGYFERKSSSTTQLSVEVSELHGGEDGVLRLTCVSTIPGYVSHNEKYADIRQHSVIIYGSRLKGNAFRFVNESISNTAYPQDSLLRPDEDRLDLDGRRTGIGKIGTSKIVPSNNKKS
ncbi:hypothetical protein FQA39_LY12462 [Lamprigera yunnana]|nr:hypothetical protein FQA39_LY12462 [Lamprigera yunnana]